MMHVPVWFPTKNYPFITPKDQNIYGKLFTYHNAYLLTIEISHTQLFKQERILHRQKYFHWARLLIHHQKYATSNGEELKRQDLCKWTRKDNDLNYEPCWSSPTITLMINCVSSRAIKFPLTKQLPTKKYKKILRRLLLPANSRITGFLYHSQWVERLIKQVESVKVIEKKFEKCTRTVRRQLKVLDESWKKWSNIFIIR